MHDDAPRVVYECYYSLVYVCAGKTHTMGSSVGLLSSQDEGLIPRVLRSVFDFMSESAEQQQQGDGDGEGGSRVINLRVSFVEIYNEEIR
jgi:hypothetical protein